MSTKHDIFIGKPYTGLINTRLFSVAHLLTPYSDVLGLLSGFSSPSSSLSGLFLTESFPGEVIKKGENSQVAFFYERASTLENGCII